MAVAILGDLCLTKMVSSPFFKSRIHMDYAAYQVSSMTSLQQYDMLLPAGVKYLLVGCLGPLLIELRHAQGENREVSISKYSSAEV